MKNINKQLVQQTKTLLKGIQTDPIFIWKCLDQANQSQSNVYYYSLKLFQTLINSQKKIDFSENYQPMLSTLLILQFYKNMKQKPQTLINDSKQLFSENHMKLYGHAQWVVDIFLKNSQQTIFAKQFISRVCHAPKKISWKIQPGKQFEDIIQSAQIYGRQLQMQRLKIQKIHKTLKYNSYPQSFYQSKILSYGYICLIDYLRSTNLQVIRQIYQHMLDLLKGFIHAIRVTQKTNELFLSYLFLLKNLLTFYGCKFDDILKQMIYLMNIARNFSSVLGQMANQLFQIIHNELKTKGTTFRKKIKYDFPSIDMKNSQNLSKKIIILSNQAQIFNISQSIMINNLRKLFIYNILGCCTGGDQQNITKLWKNIELIDAQNTYKIYFKISRILDMSMNIQNYTELQKLQKQSITQLFKYNLLAKGKIPKDEIQQLFDVINHENSMKYFSYPIPQTTQIKFQNYENRKHFHSINQLFQGFKSANSQFFYQNKLSLAIFGDDYQFNKWTKSLIYLMQQMPIQYLNRLQIYLFPTKIFNSSLAQYLASKDLWYKRFVYYVFKQKVLFPDVNIDQTIKGIFPSYLLNKSFQMYIRQAQMIFPVQTYKCILKIKQVQQEQVVYFTNHLLIGSSAQIQIIKNNLNDKTKKQSMDSLDLYLDKIKKPLVMTVDLQISYKETLTNQTTKRIEKKLIIQDLQICNTPRQYFMGNIPNPSDKFLQMSILTQKMGRVFRKQLQNKQTFKRNNQHQIRQAFKDLFINVTADYIGIQNQTEEPLKVIIDGAATNKVQRILILPVFNKEKFPVRLPIKHFLPFQI